MDYIDNSKIKSCPAYKGLVVCAIAAGAFSILFAVLLIINADYMQKTFPENTIQMRKLQKQYRVHPDDQSLVERIRSLDAKIRREELRCQRFSIHCALYFIICLMAAAGFLLTSRLMLKPEPLIPAQQLCAGELIIMTRYKRIALISAGAVFAAAAVFFSLYKPS